MMLHRHFLAALAVLAALLFASCGRDNEKYCCTDPSCADTAAGIVSCPDSDAPFCDNAGEYPESGGIGRTCIPDPLATDCTGPDDCTTAERPFCLDTVCVQCEEHLDCDLATPACDPVSHLCGGCTIDDECMDRPGETRCFVDEGACVACLEADDCTSATAPVCDDASHACRGCAADSECPSDVCDVGAGSCVDETDVIYLATTGAAGTCTRTSPCATFAQGLAQVSGARSTIKAGAGMYTAPITVTALTVSIHGEGATVQPGAVSQDGVTVTNGADVTIDGLTMTAAVGPGNPAAVRCGGGTPSTLRLHRVAITGNDTGIGSTSCAVTIEASTISENTGGGVSISGGSFSLVNNFIVRNGGATSLLGGVYLPQVSGTPHVFEFNTVANNAATTSVTSGVLCGTVTVPVIVSSSIIYGNGTDAQVSGSAMCTAVYSDVGPMVASGMGNINMVPMFVDGANGDFHLQETSPARGVADPAATLTVDVDGDARAAGASDMGADEFVR